jgi:hypothetical protein
MALWGSRMRDDTPASYPEALDTLSGRGSLAFDIPAARKKQFASNIQRQKKALIMARRNRSWLGRKWALFYGLYAELCLMWVSRGVPSMEHAFLVYQTAHHAIDTIEGEKIDDGTIRVTYRGRP